VKTDSGTLANSTGLQRSVWLPTWPRLTAPIGLGSMAGHLVEPARPRVIAPGVAAEEPTRTDGEAAATAQSPGTEPVQRSRVTSRGIFLPCQP